MSTPLESLAREALAALVNGTVQGCLVTLLVVLLLSRLRQLNAATRHAALMVTLFVVAALPVLQWGSARLDSSRAVPAEFLHQDATETATVGTAVIPETPTELAVESLKESNPTAPALESADEPTANAAPGHSAWKRLESWFQNTTPQFWITRWSLGIPGRWVMGLLALMALGSIVLLARLAHQYRQLRALKRSLIQPEPETLELFEEVRRDSAIDRPVRLVLHEEAPVPLALGFAKPAVVLPTDLAEEAPASELKQILRHEMAHLLRRDDWANLCQQTLRALFFFHPAVWILSRRLTVEREIACDDQVIATASNPRDYALLLCEFAGRQSGHPSVAASAAWSQPSQLKERIHMLLNPDRNASPRLARGRFALLAACSLGVALAGLRAAPRLSLPAPAASSADAAPSASAVTVAVRDENTPTVSVETSSLPVVSTEGRTLIASAPKANSSASVAVIASSRSLSEDSAPLHKNALLPEAPVPQAAFPPTPALPPVPAVNAVHVEISDHEAPEAPEPPEPNRRRAISKPVPVSSREEALERRIQRLEKRVQELAAQNRDLASVNGNRVEKRIEFGPARPGADLALRDGPEFKPDARPSDPFPGPEFAEKVKRDVERAMRDQERAIKNAQREIERAQKEAAEAQANQVKAKRDSKDAEVMKRDFDLEREKLRQERAALDAERRAMDQQIRTLEKQLAKMERDRDRDRDRDSNRSKKTDPTALPGNDNQDTDPLVKPPVLNKP